MVSPYYSKLQFTKIVYFIICYWDGGDWDGRRCITSIFRGSTMEELYYRCCGKVPIAVTVTYSPL